MHTEALKYRNSSLFQRWMTYLRRLYCLETLKSKVRSERDSLREMTDRELHDIGITREQALAEANRSFDDLPENRSCK